MAYYFNLPQIVELTIEQQTVLNEPKAIAISGGPGTGKSVVCLWRHLRNHDGGKKKSLLLTYTKTLETYLEASARSQGSEAANYINRTYKWLSGEKAVYDEIIIDEAQDVNIEAYGSIGQFTTSVSYGADENQSLYPNKASTEEQLKSLFKENKEYPLYDNFRNSLEIMQFVKSLFPLMLIPQSTLDTLREEDKRGNKPFLLLSNGNDSKQEKAIIDIINEFGSDTHNIAILVPLRSQVKIIHDFLVLKKIKCSKFESDMDQCDIIENVHVTTFKSAKGTEFDTVIIPNFESFLSNIANLNVVTENDYYVALTRAKRNLYLISKNELPFLSQSTYQKETI